VLRAAQWSRADLAVRCSELDTDVVDAFGGAVPAGRGGVSFEGTDGVPDVSKFTSDEFRTVLGNFCSGITAIAAVVDGQPVGMTCQSFFSVSLAPPMIAFAPSKISTTYPTIRSSAYFSVNVLAGQQADVSAQFSQSGGDKWVGINWAMGKHGTPVIDGALAWLECSFAAEYPAGDHFIAVGIVHALGSAPQLDPLLYFRSRYTSLTLRPWARRGD